MDNSNLAKRIKKYESVSKSSLINRIPVIIRLDGKAFHTFTIGLKRPFDDILIKSMQETTKLLCENIQGCVVGYTQSDEITLVLTDYNTFETCAWYDYEVQKMCSISASMASVFFNKEFVKNVYEYCCKNIQNDGEYCEALKRAVNKGAMFDSRAFNVSKEEVTNCIYWRQLDASRNSVQMVGQANFSHRQLQNKTCEDIKDMLISELNINWNNIETFKKRGSCIIKSENGWIIDYDIPMFKGAGREYIEKLI